MLGFLLSKTAFKIKLKKQKQKKKPNILQELANKNSIKCLSHCYCGMSMEFSVVLGAVMTGGKTTRRHHCSQIRLMILNWADVSTKPLSPSPRPPAHTITSGQSGQSQTTEVLSDIRDPFCILRFKQAPIRLAVLLVQQKMKCKLWEKKKGGLQHFLAWGGGEGGGCWGIDTRLRYAQSAL